MENMELKIVLIQKADKYGNLVKVFINDEQIGSLKSIKFQANSDGETEVEIEFPLPFEELVKLPNLYDKVLNTIKLLGEFYCIKIYPREYRKLYKLKPFW